MLLFFVWYSGMEQQQLIAILTSKLDKAAIEYSKEPKIGIDNRYHYLYLTYNIINHRFYVGIHTTDRPFDKHYHGSGIAIKQAITKYRTANLPTVAIGYFKDAESMQYGEQIVVDDAFLVEFANITYNVKTGGLTNSINRQHSEFMKALYSDPKYKQFWQQRVEQCKLNPTGSYKQTPQQRAERYRHCGELSRARMLELKERDREQFDQRLAKMRACSIAVNGKAVNVTDLKSGQTMTYCSKRDAARALSVTKTIIDGLLRQSTKSKYANLYSVQYVDPQLQQSVDPIKYKGHSSHMRPVSCYDDCGHLIQSFPSVVAAAKWAQVSNSTVIGNAIKHNYTAVGYRWKYN